jgi:hypothetical protein
LQLIYPPPINFCWYNINYYLILYVGNLLPRFYSAQIGATYRSKNMLLILNSRPMWPVWINHFQNSWQLKQLYDLSKDCLFHRRIYNFYIQISVTREERERVRSDVKRTPWPF